MRIIESTSEHISAWLSLRRQLWPGPDEDHLPEMQEILASDAAALLQFEERDSPVGFIEGALYQDGPEIYGYVEGWFVEPAFRRRGLGGRLIGALEEWLLHHSIPMVLSDTIPKEYPFSTRAHHRHGYETLKKLTVFMKKINSENESGNDQT